MNQFPSKPYIDTKTQHEVRTKKKEERPQWDELLRGTTQIRNPNQWLNFLTLSLNAGPSAHL